MTTADSVARTDPEVLRSLLNGDVFFPGDDGYDDARLAWNRAADQRPAAVVFAESAADVMQAVRFARARGMRIAPQGTGHGATSLEPLDGAMLLKTSRMRRVDIDPASSTARTEAGALWQDVTVPASLHGLAALAGSSPNVGVTGYTLGGGLSWLSRRYGLAANSVTAAELVTSAGVLVRADVLHEPDLFWAVKGGGGSVGVVTALEMRLFPVQKLYAGALFFPIERGREVLTTWRQWTEGVPDEVSSVGRLLRLPSDPAVPELLRGRALAVVEAACLVDAFAGADLLRPLRELGPELDTFGTIPPPVLQQLHMDPDLPVAGGGDGAFLVELTADAIDAVVRLAGPGVQTPLLSVEFRHLGGALAHDAPIAGAQPRLDAKYVMFAGGIAPTPEQAAIVIAAVRALKDALMPWHASYDYYNFVETPAQADAVLSRASYARLQEIKATYDPDQMIISAHPVRPPGY
jgi:FAD/FMN-containing dehydrogenase